ncbi:cold-shock protein [Bradyrhizobium sp. JYMT SZCCT0428]|uniref:cold-shock protein n=1 Tax=Bradyrhizobium sp. JYMT SZCCT0428 TaxID=2807673 RepID=UPI001BAA028D|nr:cold shock domain-containing protein [Bradyrhizobium sp. JYMT SZCCT0428]MBR1154816.1 cold-shock protein [Bradyrhizobium sp. JYMT SZCCT0428]
MYTGTIKVWNDDRGFGFIQRDDGPDVFMHVKFLAGTFRPAPGQRVAFDIVPDQRSSRERADGIRLA